jgi:hypothetical protein
MGFPKDLEFRKVKVTCISEKLDILCIAAVGFCFPFAADHEKYNETGRSSTDIWQQMV